MQALCTVLLSCLALAAARPDIGLSLRNQAGGNHHAHNHGHHEHHHQQTSFNNGGSQGSGFSIEPQQLQEVPQNQQGGFRQQLPQVNNNGGNFRQQPQQMGFNQNSQPSRNFAQQSTFISQSNNGGNTFAGASASSSFGGIPQGNGNARNTEPIVTKHIYVHAAPEEEDNIRPQGTPQETQKQVHYKIIFIKAPSYASPQQIAAQAAAQNEEKTIVYVLVKNPEDAQAQASPAPVPHTPSKPEVFFIKYKSNDGNGNAGNSPANSNGQAKIQQSSNGAANSFQQNTGNEYPTAGNPNVQTQSNGVSNSFQQNTGNGYPPAGNPNVQTQSNGVSNSFQQNTGNGYPPTGNPNVQTQLNGVSNSFQQNTVTNLQPQTSANDFPSSQNGYPQAAAPAKGLSLPSQVDMDEVLEENIRISGTDLVEEEGSSFEAPVDAPSLDEEDTFEPSKDLQEPISLSKNSVTNTVQQVSSVKTNGGVSNFASISTSTLTGGQRNDNSNKDYLPPKFNKRSSFKN